MEETESAATNATLRLETTNASPNQAQDTSGYQQELTLLAALNMTDQSVASIAMTDKASAFREVGQYS